MSDVVWAAIIAVAGSGTVAYVGARTTQAVARRTSETAIATAERQAAVELAKLQGDLDRVHVEQRHAERSNRQGTYHRTLAVLDRLDMFATGYHPEDEKEYTLALAEFNTLAGGIRLFGAEPVREALHGLRAETERLGGGIAEYQAEGLTFSAAFGRAYRERRNEINAAADNLTEAMRADVTREILE
jgi:hypothetical protein